MLLAQKRQRQAVAGKIGHDDYQYKLNGDPSNHRDHINIRGQGDLDPRRFGGVSRPPFAVDGEDGSGGRGGNNNNNNGGSGDGGGAGGLLLSDGRGGGAGGAGGLGALGLGAGLFSKAVAPLPDPGELPGPLPAVYRPKPPPLLHAKNPSSLLIPHYVATPMPSTGAGGAGLLTVPAGGAGAAAPLLSGGGGGGGDGLLSARPHTSPSLSPLRLVDQPGAVIHAPAALRPGSGSFLYDDGASEREERVKLKMESRRRAQEYQQVNAWQMEDQRRRRQEDHQRDLMQEREQEGRLVKEREQVRQRELLDIAREQYDRDVKMLGNKAVKPQILIEHELRSGLSPTPSPTSAAAAGTGGLGSSTPRKRHVIVLDGDEEWDENTQRSASATRAAPLATPVTPIPAKISHPWLSQPLPLTPVPDPRAAAQPQPSSAAPSAAAPAPPLFRGAVPLAPITPLERPSRPTTNGLGLGLPPPSTFLSSVEPVEFHFPSNQGLGLGLHNTNSNSNSNHGSTAASMMAGFSYENDSIRRDVQNLASAQRRLEQTVASGRFQLNPLTGSGRGGATYLTSPHPLNQLPIYTPPNRSPPPPAPNLFPGDAGAAGVGGGSRSPPSLFTTDYTSSHVEQHHHHHGAPRSGTPETPSQHGGTVPWNADAIIQLSPIRGGGGGPGSPFGSKAPTSGHDWCPSPSAADRSSASPLPPPSEDLAVACVVLRSPAETPTGQQHQHHQLPLPPVIHISNGSTPTFTSIPPGTVLPDPDAEAVAPSPRQQASTESSAPSSSTHNVGVSHNSDLEVEPGKFVGAPGQLKFSGSLNAKYGHTTTMTTTTTTHATTTTTAPPPAPPASSSVSGVVAASLNTPVRQDRTGRNAEGSSPTTHSPVHEPNSTSLKESVD